MPLPGRLRGTLALTALSLVLAGSLATSAWALPDFDGDGAVAPQDCNPLDGAVAPGRPDAPDLAFEDTNCDGIDGDVARAVFVSLGGSNAGTGCEGEPAADHRSGHRQGQGRGQGRLRRRRHVHGVRQPRGRRRPVRRLHAGDRRALGERGDDHRRRPAGRAGRRGDRRRAPAAHPPRAPAQPSGETAYGLRAINGSSVALRGRDHGAGGRQRGRRGHAARPRRSAPQTFGGEPGRARAPRAATNDAERTRQPRRRRRRPRRGARRVRRDR